jgi:hypothetical protein
MLVDHHVKRVEIPHEPGEWMELRRLSFGEMRELNHASRIAYLEGLADVPEQVLEVQLRVEADMAEARRRAKEKAEREAAERGEPPADEPAAPEPPADPLLGRDLDVVLRFGVVAWSYADADGKQIPVSGEAVAMLDRTTAEWAAREILCLTESDPLGSSPSSTAPSTG